jgi:hypothetical protein
MVLDMLCFGYYQEHYRRMLHKQFHNRSQRFQQLTALMVVFVVAAIGTYILTSSHAASPYASTTASNGTLSGSAISQSCSGASDSSCVMFGGNLSSVIVGTNGTGGWSTIADAYKQAGVTWDRLDFDNPTYDASTNTTPLQYPPSGGDFSTWQSYGLNALGILKIDPDYPYYQTLSSLTPAQYATWGMSVIKEYPGINLWEVDNEPYDISCNSGLSCAAVYGAQYLALYNALQGSGIQGKTLIFSDWGDYDDGAISNWSGDANAGGWLHDALCANGGVANTTGVPGVSENCSTVLNSSNYASSLAHAIEHEALSLHPYGPISGSDYCNTNGAEDEYTPYALTGPPAGASGTDCPVNSYCPSGCSMEQIDKDWLGQTFGDGTIPPIYVTEYGIEVGQVGTSSSPVSDPGYNTPCQTQLEGQAYLLTEAYDLFFGDPHVKGVWWYEATDNQYVPGPDGQGDWGAITTDPEFSAEPTGTSARPALAAMQQFENYNPNSPPQPQSQSGCSD